MLTVSVFRKATLNGRAGETISGFTTGKMSYH